MPLCLSPSYTLYGGPGIFISDHLGGFTAKEGLFMFGWATRRALIRVTRQRPTKNGNSASEGLSMDRKSSEIFAAIERRLRADQEEGNHSARAAAGSVDSSLNLLGIRSPSERAFKASIIEASSYHREWRAPLPRRKSTNPPANSCGREVTLLPSGCSRT